ncbi:MAG: zinc ribbon domain-containing protein YjdM [Francisella sp.]
MTQIPPCPKCQSTYVYEDASLFICPECAYEWSQVANDDLSNTDIIRDANGTELKDGDTICVIKDLKFRGGVVKIGTKIKYIRLIPEAVDGHNIDCKIPGIGQIMLKSEFVKKLSE